MIRFEWDERKRLANIAKHGVDFAAVAGFDFGTALVSEDTRFDYGERRYRALGWIGSVAHMLVFTPRGRNVRVISLRPATAKERNAL